MTVQDTFDNFLHSRFLADLAEKTISDYMQFVSPFIAFIGPTKTFDSLTQEDIEQYLSVLLKRPLSRSSKATYIRHVKI